MIKVTLIKWAIFWAAVTTAAWFGMLLVTNPSAYGWPPI